VVVLLETEFWPNFLRQAHRTAKVAVVNARISDRSLPGYQRHRKFIGGVLENVDLFLAQSEGDAQRLVRIGAAAERVQVGGNLKFDWSPPLEAPIVDAMRRKIAEQQLFPVIVAGSTVDGEDALVMHAFEEVCGGFPNALLILAPRHPERFGSAADAVSASGFQVRRRSEWKGESLEIAAGIFLLDSIGELASLYQLADIAFVGGSLVPRGGHNILEPAYFGRPILVGPYMENFRDIAKSFLDAHALTICNEKHLGKHWSELAGDVKQRTRLGMSALAVMEINTGATARTLAALKKLEAQK
jgi:3-deoxy-D-manno-octulosonic-acid transferase